MELRRLLSGFDIVRKNNCNIGESHFVGTMAMVREFLLETDYLHIYVYRYIIFDMCGNCIACFDLKLSIFVKGKICNNIGHGGISSQSLENSSVITVDDILWIVSGNIHTTLHKTFYDTVVNRGNGDIYRSHEHYYELLPDVRDYYLNISNVWLAKKIIRITKDIHFRWS